MNKKLLLIPAFAMGLAFASCSNEDPSNNTNGNGNFETNYLSINLVQAPDMASRAGDPQPDGAKYEDGNSTENTVKKVRFYFFDDDGTAVSINTDDTNFFDWDDKDVNTSVGKDEPNVEKQLKAVILINTKEGENIPTKVVAILNPDSENLGQESLNLSSLRTDENINDYASLANATSSSFVMANSVYSKNSKEIVATAITQNDYFSSPEAAKNSPVNIYVERNVAKVRVYFDDKVSVSNGKIALKDSEGKAITANGQQVYLKLGKWNLTADTDKSNLIKKIDPSWGQSTNHFTDWNWDPYYRSFWAKNANNAAQQWHNYNEIDSNGALYTTSDGNVIYANENAPDEVYGSTTVYQFTKVILSGTLVSGSDDEPVTLTKYAGVVNVGEEALKAQLLNSLKGKLYSVSGSTYSEIGTSDVEFKTAIQSNIPGVEKNEKTTGRYYVYLQLSEDGAKKTWTKSNNGDTQDQDKFNSKEDVNKFLAVTPGKAQIWQSGKTYYYFPIKHLGEIGEIGEYGVVRNHIYDCKITTLVGLGTPVYNPGETIWPEKPVDDETYIAAQINILSWRLVSQDVNLTW